MKSKLVLSFSFIVINILVYGQQMAYVDPAQAYNRLLIEKSGDSYMRIKNYKVIGSPYLFGQKIKVSFLLKDKPLLILSWVIIPTITKLNFIQNQIPVNHLSKKFSRLILLPFIKIRLQVSMKICILSMAVFYTMMVSHFTR